MNYMKRRKTKKILRKGKALIEKQGAVSIGFGTSVKTCAIGALGVAQGLGRLDATGSDARNLLDDAAAELYPGYFAGSVNDYLGYYAVLAIYEKALTL